MFQKNENQEEEVVEKEETSNEGMHNLPMTLSPEEGLRLELLNISKDILLGKAAMHWETHKSYKDVSFDDIIKEAKKMFNFVRGIEWL